MSDELVSMILEDAATKMGKSVAHTREEFAAVRTGRASPALVEKLPVEYYGSDVPLQQLAGFAVPEARTLVITPFDKSALGAIEKAIQQSDLGLNPSSDGTIIRLNFPQLTEERRKDYVRVVKQKAASVIVWLRENVAEGPVATYIDKATLQRAWASVLDGIVLEVPGYDEVVPDRLPDPDAEVVPNDDTYEG